MRCVTVLLPVTGGGWALITWLLPVALAGGARPDGILIAGCAGLGSVVAAWLWVVVVLTVAEAAAAGAGRPPAGSPAGARRTARLRGLRAPSGLRRIVLWACGATTVASLSVPAAHADARRDAPTVGSVVAGVLHPHDRPARPAVRVETVTVRRGDCLWAIAERDLAAVQGLGLPRGAHLEIDDGEIDRRWRAIYAANRDLIGDDPDLIRPAQRLRLHR